MRKDHFEKKFHDEIGWYYCKTKFQKQKQHVRTSQDIRKGGIIPFETNEFGVNPGEILQMYLTHLNPDNVSMFQLAKTGKNFHKYLHKSQTNGIYYCNSPMGKMTIAQMMPKVNKRIFFSKLKIMKLHKFNNFFLP